MSKKKLTIDELGQMVAKGFFEQGQGFKTEIGDLRKEMLERFERVEHRFDEVDRHFARIENVFNGARLDKIEDDIRVLKMKAGIR